MAALFDVRQGFYLCNQRCGSALRWDKLITLFSEPLNQDKRKLTPQSSLSHSCALCCALSALYLSQHNAAREAVFNRTNIIKRIKICSARCTALANPLKSPNRREDGNALCWDSDLVSDTSLCSFFLFVHPNKMSLSDNGGEGLVLIAKEHMQWLQVETFVPRMVLLPLCQYKSMYWTDALQWKPSVVEANACFSTLLNNAMQFSNHI